MHDNSSRLIVIMGPTASGKSALALDLARRTGGEIISVDSMQLYRGIEIGTAQPTAAERREIPHHLVGIYDFSQKANVYDFVNMAEEKISEIRSRGRLPIAVGGTGFYLKSMLYALDDIPGDNALRAELNQKYDSPEQEEALFQRLNALDPAAAQKFRQCRRRMVRALEVWLLTGQSILALQSGASPVRRHPEAEVYRIDPDGDLLRQRIAGRARQMLASGWIEEARAAIANGIFDSPTVWQALGYRQIADYLANRCDYATMEQRIITATWQFARRQRTWFAHQHPEAQIITSDTKLA